MSTPSRSLIATAAIALLAGCSGGSAGAPIGAVQSQSIGRQNAQSTQPAQHAGFRADVLAVRPGVTGLLAHGTPHFVPAAAAFTGTAWVTDAGKNALYKVTAKGKITAIGSGWSEPQGVAIDAKGNVYVADTANARVVVLTKAGKPLTILNDPGEFPVGVSVSTTGVIGVTNIISQSGGAGSVSFYSSLAETSPTSTASGLFYQDYFGGFDAQGNFYVDGEDPSGGIHVGVVAPGGTTVTDTGIDTSAYLFPGGVQVVQSGKGKKAVQTLTVGDQEALAVYTYALPSYTPGATVALGGSGDPVSYSFQKNLKQFGVADAENASVEFYAWPAGGSAPAATITGFEEPVGIGIVATGDE